MKNMKVFILAAMMIGFAGFGYGAEAGLTDGDRAINMARHQYKLVHTFSSYDFEVDTSVLTSQECAQKIKSFTDTHEPKIFKGLP